MRRIKAPPTPGLIIERIPLAELTADAANVRTHDEKNLAAITGSLKQFGQAEPLVLQKSTGRVIGGNGRLEAMKALGWTHADVVRLELDATQASALAIALNRTGELAAWDYEGLAGLLRGLSEDGFDLNSIGWSEHELGPLLAGFSAAAISDEDFLAPGTDEPGVEPVKLTQGQRAVFLKACARARSLIGAEASEGACLELIAETYLVNPKETDA